MPNRQYFVGDGDAQLGPLSIERAITLVEMMSEKAPEPTIYTEDLRAITLEALRSIVRLKRVTS